MRARPPDLLTAATPDAAVPGGTVPDVGAGDVGAGDVAAVDVGTVLRHGRERVEPLLRDAVARLDPTSRAATAHHLGWTGADGEPVSGGGGKAVRPALVLLAARVAGGDALGADAAADRAVAGAAAVELVHNFSLVHDDLMDGDVERRHRPTVWARWGTATAVLTGDAMLALAQEVVLDADSPHAAHAARVLAVAVRELVRGQVDDVAFERRDDVTVEQCLAMADGKTAALLAAAGEVGAVLAGAEPAAAAALRAYGSGLGTAFQLVDDLLGIWGDPARTGKPVLADLRARKKSLPVTWAIQYGGRAGHELGAWLATPARGTTTDADEADLHHAADLVERAGGRRWAGREARRCLARAEHALWQGTDGADATSARARTELIALGRSLADRES